MKKIFASIVSTVLYCLIFASIVNACEPCAEIYDFNQSTKEADLIIIGKKIGEQKGEFTYQDNGPEWIKVRIQEVLKGQIEKVEIIVNSWDAMCSYGIHVVEGEDHVILLKKRQRKHEDFQFDAVNFGCAQKSYQVKEGQIDLDGKLISISELKEKIRL